MKKICNSAPALHQGYLIIIAIGWNHTAVLSGKHRVTRYFDNVLTCRVISRQNRSFLYVQTCPICNTNHNGRCLTCQILSNTVLQHHCYPMKICMQFYSRIENQNLLQALKVSSKLWYICEPSKHQDMGFLTWFTFATYPQAIEEWGKNHLFDKVLFGSEQAAR